MNKPATGRTLINTTVGKFRGAQEEDLVAVSEISLIESYRAVRMQV